MNASDDDLYSFLQGTEISPKAKSDVPITHTDEEEDEADLTFDTDGVGEELRHRSEAELDDAPFGIIRLNDEGVVTFYNRYESELSGIPADEAVGRNFFTELAPCSNNRLFEGRFQDGLTTGDLNERFTYTFTYKVRPTLVDVRLYRDEAGHNWVMIHKR